MTNKLLNVNAGDELILHEVFGAINYKGPGLFIAGGAGVTPFIADNRLNDSTLLFANKSTEDIILRGEFEEMLGDRFINILDKSDDPKIKEGHIDKELLKQYVKGNTQYYYVCGPDKFVEVMAQCLQDLGINKSQIVIEE
jgi:ferredoxin-NADP reductase